MYTDANIKSKYEAELALLFGEFGTVVAVQVRMEQGIRDTWALVSFSKASAAQSAIASAARRLSEREQHRRHRLQGSTKLGAVQQYDSCTPPLHCEPKC